MLYAKQNEPWLQIHLLTYNYFRILWQNKLYTISIGIGRRMDYSSKWTNIEQNLIPNSHLLLWLQACD